MQQNFSYIYLLLITVPGVSVPNSSLKTFYEDTTHLFDFAMDYGIGIVQ